MRNVAFALMALAAAGTLAAASADAPASKTYELKSWEAPTGSHIRRSGVDPGIVPFDKRYDGLTPEQQRAFKDQYEGMPDADEPPFPAEGLQSIYGALASIAMRLNVEGPIEMHVEVDEKGVARAVQVLRTPRQDMIKPAATVLMLEKYKPGMCGGKPCRMQLPVRTTLRKPTDTYVHRPFDRMPK
jgi:hypothetical protein